MPAIAKVVVDIAPLNKEFDYKIPDKLLGRLSLGARVSVPFGRSTVSGFVVGFADRSGHGHLKDIGSIEEEAVSIDESMLRLVRWMGEYYCSSLEQAIRTVLPSAVRRKGARFRKQMFVSLSSPNGVCLQSKDLSTKQNVVVELLRNQGCKSLTELTSELGITSAPVLALQKKGLVSIASQSVRRDPLAGRNILPTEPLKLMKEQGEALCVIRRIIDLLASEAEGQNAKGGEAGKKRQGESSVVLLHGVTGSGKTEVYLQAIDSVLRNGSGAIVLVPEISLTPQTLERFIGRFGSNVAVLHSHLSDGERHDEWHRIRDGHANIVIGARSAVFAPVKKLGLIVVDEEHEPSYKQEDAPRYNARDVAVMRGLMENCVVILGSATPCLESWANVKKEKYQLVRLSRRVDKREMPLMRIIDMRVETERTGRMAVFSRDLLEAIRVRLERAEQVILFLNRRGFACSLTCPRCGHVAVCSQCSVSYTYHYEDDKLRCHICGNSKSVPGKCPGCGDLEFKFTGVGTQRIEKIVQKCFPHAHVQRMDADVTSRKDSYERILGDFKSGKTNILIGTQMIAKGLHFPNVTLVGIVYADLSLHMPDFRAGERTFQLLAQVAGRAGRGDTQGEVIVQTYTPFNSAVQAARRLDYDGFCDQEMAFRKELGYPPFKHLICITIKGQSDEKTSFCCKALVRELKKKLLSNVVMSDSAPAPLRRAKGFYRWQVMLRCTSTGVTTRIVKDVVNGFKFPKGITCSVDVDALNLM